jgi:hypothetical protein
VRYRLLRRLIGFGSPHAYWIVGRFSALTERHGPRGFNLNLVPRACESSCDSARRGRQLATACSLLGSPYPPTGVAGAHEPASRAPAVPVALRTVSYTVPRTTARRRAAGPARSRKARDTDGYTPRTRASRARLGARDS